jgi:hypothetical protein
MNLNRSSIWLAQETELVLYINQYMEINHKRSYTIVAKVASLQLEDCFIAMSFMCLTKENCICFI